ncbi:hypothetical protein L226DRAFT_362766 [Lentinus tigrinus ALCF2SS1-7]|uniref:uncharacterized protein n=1 Tax=Lentinus tigrinus ALCF2SS1-7 TaxID=1328758 RepID=UPI001165E846|nr:hypothetical protein L226DRAFT_362766 [Lentinus tigrinus ALCF2SS1-7]
MFTPTVVYRRETRNITVVDDADIPWPVRPIDFPAPDDEIVPYLNEAWQGELNDQTLTEITLPLTFSYTFTGTQRVALYGVALPRLNETVATAKYTLDDRPPVVLQPANVLDTLTDTVFFSADDLSAGSHTLTVEVNAGPSYPYVVDYLQYESFDANPAVPSFSTTSSLTTSTNAPPPSTSSTTAATSPTSAPSVASASNNVGVIIGGVIGGLALLCIMVVALVWHLHRQRSQDGIRKASIFSADCMVQPPSRPLPAHVNVPVKIHPYKMTKTMPTSRASTVITAYYSDVKSASCTSSPTSTPVSERPPTIRLEPPSRIAPSSYRGGRWHVPSFNDAYELFGSPPAYSLK